MTIDYSAFNGKTTGIWGNGKPTPTQVTRIGTDSFLNTLRRMQDMFALTTSNFGIFPAAALRTATPTTSASYYDQFCTEVSSVYYDFYVSYVGAYTITVGPGLAYDSAGRRIALYSSDTTTYSATNPTATDSYGYPLPQSTGRVNVDLTGLAAGTYKVYVVHLPVIVSATSSPEKSVDINTGAVRYTNIDDGYKVVVLAGATTAPDDYVLVATLTLTSSGLTSQSSIDNDTGRVTITLPGALMSAALLPNGINIVQSFYDHINAVGSGTSTFATTNVHRLKASDLDGYSAVDETLRVALSNISTNGLVARLAADYAGLSMPALVGSVGSSTALTITGLPISTKFIYLNGLPYGLDGDGSTEGTLYDGINDVALSESTTSITIDLAALDPAAGTYYIFWEAQTGSSYRAVLTMDDTAPDPGSSTDRTRVFLCTFTFAYVGGTKVITAFTDLRDSRFGVIGSPNIQPADGTTAQDVTKGSGIKTTHIQDSAVTAAKIDSVSNGILIPIGGMLPYGGATAPSGFLLCDGAAISRTTYSALYAILGTKFGSGDGSSTFNLPNLVDKMPIGSGNLYATGATGGEATHTLTTTEMPSHSHSHNHTATVTDPGHAHNMGRGDKTTAGSTSNDLLGLGYTGADTGTAVTGISVSISTDATTSGSGNAHNNLPPYLAAPWIIRAY